MRRFLRRLLTGSAARRGVVAMASGTLAGQLILSVGALILARVYSTEAFGVLSLVVALAAIAGPAATLKLEAALLLPDDEDDARRLLRASVVSAALGAGLAGIAVWIADAYGASTLWGGVDYAPTWVAGMVFATATFGIVSQAALRERHYGTVAARSVTQSLGIVGGQLGFALLSRGPAGLLGGLLLGRFVGYVPLIRVLGGLRSRPVTGSYREVLRRYWRFPLVFTPSNLLNTLGTQLPLILIGAAFGASAAGHLGMAQRLAFLPSSLLGAALAKAFGAELAKRVRERGDSNRGLYLRISGQMAIVAALLMLALLALSPWLFPILLGEAWAESGLFAQAMAVSVGLGLIASPVSRVFWVYQSTRIVAIDVARVAMIAGAAVLAHSLDTTAVTMAWMLYGAQALNYVMSWFYGLRVASGAPPRG